MRTRDEVLREFPVNLVAMRECYLNESVERVEHMASRIAQQEARIRELEADAKRLDWLEIHPFAVPVTHDAHGWAVCNEQYDHPTKRKATIRAAIDHAMTPEVDRA